MGADARIFIFDYALYRESIVPAFLRFMCEGVKESWLRELLRLPEVEERVGATIGVRRPVGTGQTNIQDEATRSFGTS